MNDEHFDELYMISDRLRSIAFLRDAAIEFTFAEYSDFSSADLDSALFYLHKADISEAHALSDLVDRIAESKHSSPNT